MHEYRSKRIFASHSRAKLYKYTQIESLHSEQDEGRIFLLLHLMTPIYVNFGNSSHLGVYAMGYKALLTIFFSASQQPQILSKVNVKDIYSL